MTHGRPVERAFLSDDAVGERPEIALCRRNLDLGIAGLNIKVRAVVAGVSREPDRKVGPRHLPCELCGQRPFSVVRRLFGKCADEVRLRSEEHTSELQSLMRISYAVFGLKKKTNAC